MSLISIRNLHKNFGDLEVLKGINLEIKKGEVLSLIGRSGSGKSTLIRCLNLLEAPSSGQIFYKNQEITSKSFTEEKLNQHRQDIGMVFQQFNLFPHLTVTDNITLSPILNQNMSKIEARALAETLLGRVGLLDKKDTYPAQLSGGQKQRVAIARALAMKPEVMLFDEPTSALDPEMVKEVLMVIRGLAETGLTTIVVTHEMQFARDISSRIIFLDEGEIVEDQEPEAFFTQTQTAQAKSFLNLVI